MWAWQGQVKASVAGREFLFLKGRGAVEVYESPETLTFVHNLSEEEVASRPRLNYHPVYSQEAALEFLGVIAGARYWVKSARTSCPGRPSA